jgi:DNA primase
VYDDGSWWDYGGGFGGDVIEFVGRCLHGEHYDIHAVIDSLGALGITPLAPSTQRDQPKRPANKLGVSLDAITGFNALMPSSRRAYWHSRGLTDQTIDEFYLGWDGQRYTIPALYRFQLFGLKRRQSEIDDGISAKYTQAVGSRVGIFNADMLWDATNVIICEGEIDCMLLHQSGFVAVTSTGGAGSWKPVWSSFFMHVQKIHIIYDNDDAGRDGARKIQRCLRRAHVVSLPEGAKDIGELFEKSVDPVAWLNHYVK